jgi:urease accessory protein
MNSASTRTSPSEAGESPSHPSLAGTWTARLALHIGKQAARSTILSRRHDGPYLVQRGFHPEADGTCHVLLLHPPGGLVSGDALELELDVREGAQALLTTPAATKAYRARTSGLVARQSSHLRVHAGGQLEWFPQETIVFDGARLSLHTNVELALDARFMGWEITCLGRPAADERFAVGELLQRWAIHRAGRALWVERFHVRGDSALLSAAHGLRNAPIVGSFVCATARSDDLEPLVEQVRAQLAQHTFRGLTSVTCRGELVITRYLGPSSEEARHAFEAAWHALRPLVLHKPAAPPRIWKT